MRRVPLRWRLTAAFTVASAVVLTVLGLFLHQQLGTQLDGTLRAGLRQRAADLTAVARSRPSSIGSGGIVEPGDDLVQLLDPRGTVVAGAAGFARVALLTRTEIERTRTGPLLLATRRVGDDREPATLLAARAGERIVVVGASLESRDEALSKLDGLLLLGLPATLLLAALAGFTVAGRALRPIEQIRARAEAIGADELTHRVPEPAADDEVRRLARTLNAMLDRLQAGFTRERSFVADAGHELRTPLAALTAELELAQHPGRTTDELQAAVASAAEETRRLTRLAADLLVVARSDSGHLDLRPERVGLAPLLARVAARADAPVIVEAPGGETAWADPLRLEQALGNLLDNAVRHGAPPVTLSATTTAEDTVRFAVTDHGAGIPGQLAGREFDRFTRGDAAREGEGAGLGLAIVAAIARAHAGTAGVTRTGAATVGWLELPRGRPALPRPPDARPARRV